jgi:ATP-dependent Lon protease
MALLQRGWEDDEEEAPSIFATVCVGRVISHSRLPDGSYNLLLAGAMRGRIDAEPAADTLYRQAEVTLLADRYENKLPKGDPVLRKELVGVFRQLNPGGIASDPGVKQLLEQEVPLGVLSDVVSYAVPLRTEDKQQLLADDQVDHRTRELIRQLRALNGSTAITRPFPFPPEFSDN